MNTKPAILTLSQVFSLGVVADQLALDFVDSNLPLGLSQNTQTVGWEFSVSTPVEVTQLGIFDAEQDGLAAAHAVGIWDLAGNLLAQANVPAGVGATLDGQFRLVPVSPVNLAVGNYVIGAQMTAAGPDALPQAAASITTAPEITWLAPAYGLGSSLTFPNTLQAATTFDHFGPNFELTAPSSGKATVPDAGSTASLLGIGLLGLAALRRSTSACQPAALRSRLTPAISL
jgi:hypothetical protein